MIAHEMHLSCQEYKSCNDDASHIILCGLKIEDSVPCLNDSLHSFLQSLLRPLTCYQVQSCIQSSAPLLHGKRLLPQLYIL